MHFKRRGALGKLNFPPFDFWKQDLELEVILPQHSLMAGIIGVNHHTQPLKLFDLPFLSRDKNSSQVY
jgi:hypothetical protein